MLTTSVEISVRDKVLVLRSDPRLGGLDAEATALLATHAAWRRYNAGESLLSEGESIREVFILAEGSVEVRTPHGPLLIEAPGGIGWPNYFCELPAFESVATQPTAALVISTSVVEDFFELNFSFLRNSLRLVSQTVLQRRGGLPPGPETLSDPGPAPMGEA
ncbi:MAG: cyclic nucleotide-binding domain-containing protein, partial [Myxococcota bacterium]